jgi:peptide/nickel transport system substrate-binding protein
MSRHTRLRSGLLGHVRPVVAAAAVALSLAACGGSSPGAGSAPSPASTATSSAAPKELTIATSFAITDLDPLENGFWGPEFGFAALPMKPVGGGRLEPWLLDSLTQATPTTWSLRLRPGLSFHNGKSLDAAALAEVMNFHLKDNTSVTPLLPGATAAVTAADTVTLSTPEPVVFVPSLLAHESMFPIFDVAAYRTYKASGAGPEALVGAKIWSGPYTPTGLSADALEMVPTPGYFSGPTLSKLTVRFIPDAQARILAVRNGEADLALYPPSTAARELAGRSDAFYLTQPEGQATEGFQLLLNPRDGVLADLEVRKALRHAIDYRELAVDVLNGLYDTAVGFYPAFLPYAQRNQVSDATAAAQVLDAAGWTREGDGVRAKAGAPLRFELLTYPQQPDSQVIAVAMQAQLREAGFDVAVRQVEDITATVEADDGWDAAVMGNGTLDWTGTDPVAPLINNFAADGQTNYGGVRDTGLDDLIARLRRESDTTARDELMRQVQRIVIEDKVYSLYLTLKRVPVVAAPELRDYRVPPVALLFVDAYA